MEVPTKRNEFHRLASCFVLNCAKRYFASLCSLKTHCENATSFSKKWGGSSQNEGAFSSSLRICSSALTEFAFRCGSRTTVPHFSSLRLALSIFCLHPSPLFLSRTRPYTHVAIAYAHFTEFRFCVFTLHLDSNSFVMSGLR